MNIKKILSIIVIALLLSGPMAMTTVNAEEGSMDNFDEPTEPEKACVELKPSFESEYNDFVLKFIESPSTELTYDEVHNYLIDAQVKYHTYVQCFFDYAEDQILDSGGVKTRGTFQANAPSFPWFKPEAACISEENRKIAIKNSAPSKMLEPLLEVRREYISILDKIVPKYEQEGRESGGGEIRAWDQLANAKNNASIELRNYIDSETQSSIMAIDISLTTLKELRTAYIMHVQFQCMLNGLEKYRKVLEKIRTIVSCLPMHLQDASTS